MRIFIIVLLASTVLVSGCANLNSTFINPTIESPIVGGTKGSFGIGFGVAPAHEYEFTGDASARPPNLNDPDLSPFSSPFADGQYSLTDRFQIGLEIHPFNFGLEPKLKYQLLGDKQSGFQMSLSARGGLAVSKKDGDQSGEFGPGGHNWEGETQGQSASGGLSIGYFIHDSILLYAGAAYGSLKASAEINHKLSNDGSSPAANYKVDDSATATSLGGGVSFGSQTQVNLGVTYSEVDYDKLSTYYDTQYTVGISF